MNHKLVITDVPKPRKAAIFIPTNLPALDDPRDINMRSQARFEVGMSYARKLRAELGRANVLVILFGGWPLHGRIPLAIHHAYAAIVMHQFLTADELDFVASYGINTSTDLHGTLKWAQENLLDIKEAYVVTSKGHAERLITESGMHQLFSTIKHVETHEPRSATGEDQLWTTRAKNIPPHQYIISGRSSDVTRFGSIDSLEWAGKMRLWAAENPDKFDTYLANIWRMMGQLEENNVVVRSRTPGCWRIDINL
jgi:hypothetical protein